MQGLWQAGCFLASSSSSSSWQAESQARQGLIWDVTPLTARYFEELTLTCLGRQIRLGGSGAATVLDPATALQLMEWFLRLATDTPPEVLRMAAAAPAHVDERTLARMNDQLVVPILAVSMAMKLGNMCSGAFMQAFPRKVAALAAVVKLLTQPPFLAMVDLPGNDTSVHTRLTPQQKVLAWLHNLVFLVGGYLEHQEYLALQRQSQSPGPIVAGTRAVLQSLGSITRSQQLFCDALLIVRHAPGSVYDEPGEGGRAWPSFRMRWRCCTSSRPPSQRHSARSCCTLWTTCLSTTGAQPFPQRSPALRSVAWRSRR